MRNSKKRIRNALFVVLCLSAQHMPAVAQSSDERRSFPEQYSMTPGGVNVQTGRFIHSVTDLEIGDMKLVRTWGTPNWSGGLRAIGPLAVFSNAVHGWNHSLNGGTGLISQEDGHLEIFVEGRRYKFYHSASGAMQPSDSSSVGANAVDSGATFTLTDHSGAVHVFTSHAALSQPPGQIRNRRLTTTTRPDGTVITYRYKSNAQVQDVRSTRGYGIHFDYDGSGNLTKACGYNLAQAYRAPATLCSATLPTVTYVYNSASAGKLMSSTSVSGDISNYSYKAVSGTTGLLGCVSIPNSTTCRIENWYGETSVSTLIFPDQVSRQQSAAGVTWSYDYTPPENPSDVPVIPGAPRYSGVTVDGPKGGEFRYDRGLLVTHTGDQGTINYKYPQVTLTFGSSTLHLRNVRPTLVTYPRGDREYRLDNGRGLVQTHARWPFDHAPVYLDTGQPLLYADPEQEPCCIRWGNPIDPPGYIKYAYAYLPNFTSGAFVTGCGLGPSDAKRCSQPTLILDPNGNSTSFTYAPEHGGILTETGPPVNGITPQKRYSYVQRHAWYRQSGGAFVQAPTPVWLLDKVSHCKTGNAAGNGCAIAGDEVVTQYEYGPNSGPNNLLLRGQVEDATGTPRRTCYTYDNFGDRISETKPLGAPALGACL